MEYNLSVISALEDKIENLRQESSVLKEENAKLKEIEKENVKTVRNLTTDNNNLKK